MATASCATMLSHYGFDPTKYTPQDCLSFYGTIRAAEMQVAAARFAGWLGLYSGILAFLGGAAAVGAALYIANTQNRLAKRERLLKIKNARLALHTVIVAAGAGYNDLMTDFKNGKLQTTFHQKAYQGREYVLFNTGPDKVGDLAEEISVDIDTLIHVNESIKHTDGMLERYNVEFNQMNDKSRPERIKLLLHQVQNTYDKLAELSGVLEENPKE